MISHLLTGLCIQVMAFMSSNQRKKTSKEDKEGILIRNTDRIIAAINKEHHTKEGQGIPTQLWDCICNKPLQLHTKPIERMSECNNVLIDFLTCAILIGEHSATGTHNSKLKGVNGSRALSGQQPSSEFVMLELEEVQHEAKKSRVAKDVVPLQQTFFQRSEASTESGKHVITFDSNVML